MPTCECGCGEESARAFVPGHDQRLRTVLERRVGGILSLRSLVEVTESYANGDITGEVLSQHVRKLFAQSRLLEPIQGKQDTHLYLVLDRAEDEATTPHLFIWAVSEEGAERVGQEQGLRMPHATRLYERPITLK